MGISPEWMQRDLPGVAELHPRHPTHKLGHHHDGEHLGIWYGRAKPHHGTSRQHMSYLVGTSGTEIFSEQHHDELVNQRVRFRMAMDQTGCTSVAVDIEAVETPAVIKDIEPIEPEDKRGAAVSSPWIAPKRNRSK
jgi:hypothetical protein